jgi:hypothetical protein
MGHEEHHDLEDAVVAGLVVGTLLDRGRRRRRPSAVGPSGGGCARQARGCGCSVVLVWLVFGLAATTWSDLPGILLAMACMVGALVLLRRLRQRPRRS